jgi:glycosyltransferase involved in cell wall biosynthesis
VHLLEADRIQLESSESRRMRILLIHCFYRQTGGEDAVFRNEAELLESGGHDVVRYTLSNDDLSTMSRTQLARTALWNRGCAREIQRLVQRHHIQIAHFHNAFPQLSPSTYRAASRAGAAVVQTLHNYRLLCANGLLLRRARSCELCVGRSIPWRPVLHGCYRESRLASSAAAALLTAHRILGSYRNHVDLFLAPTEFVARVHREGGLCAERVAVKPHFIPGDPSAGEGGGGFALFVGRLSEEKGIATLLEAWRRSPRLPLKIAGEGPLLPQVQQAALQIKNVELLGKLERGEALELMKRAFVLLVPSLFYETFGLVVAEAFASGTPCIVAAPGAAAELVEPGRSGLHFRRGDAADLVSKLDWMLAHPGEVACMRRHARAQFEQKYTARENCARLTELYQLALERRSGSSRRRATADERCSGVEADCEKLAEMDARGCSGHE